MIDTVKSLLESSVLPEVDFVTKNTANLSILDPISESDRTTLSYCDPRKVMVQRGFEGNYLIEYSNNLERLMYDNDIGINEAMQMVCNANDLAMEECAVVFDKTCVDKIDIGAVIRSDPDYDIVRK